MRFGLPADAPAVTPSGGNWSLEVQIHPGDIRKRVRYLFLSRRQLTAVSIIALLYIAGVALAAALAPGIVAGLANPLEVRGLLAERRLQGERLQALVGRVDELDRHAQELDHRMAKVFIAYGLPPLARPQGAGAPGAESNPRSIYAEALEEARRSQIRLRQRLQSLDGSLGAVRAFEGAHPDQVRVTPSACPLEGEFVLVGSFGKRRSPFTREFEFHSGVDLSAPVGTPIHATADGVVVFAGQVPIHRSREWWRYGNVVIVENGDGFFTIFGHDDRIEVRPGQRVKRGDLLATVGNTGWGVTSPHVHYEVRRKDAEGTYRPVDPLIYILDHRWPNEDRLLLAARTAPPVRDFEPLPVGPTKASRKAGAS
jgi:murein DD-endopeptidase MepM/ murein hydrolase activator NlpD